MVLWLSLGVDAGYFFHLLDGHHHESFENVLGAELELLGGFVYVEAVPLDALCHFVLLLVASFIVFSELF